MDAWQQSGNSCNQKAATSLIAGAENNPNFSWTHQKYKNIKFTNSNKKTKDQQQQKLAPLPAVLDQPDYSYPDLHSYKIQAQDIGSGIRKQFVTFINSFEGIGIFFLSFSGIRGINYVAIFIAHPIIL